MSQPLAPSEAETHRAERAAHTVRLLGHDLRAALTDIVDGLRLIDPSELPEASRAQFDRARSAGNTLTRLLDAALEPPEGTEAEPGAPGQGDLDFHRFLHEIEQRWGGRAAGAGLWFRARIGAAVPPRIRCNRTGLDRILSNLLGNAIKFTQTGTIELRADIRPGNEMRLTVADTGPGFSDAALFGVFDRGPGPGRSSRDGSGLGLHIARSIAVGLGGRLQASNGAQGGAEVSLLLPEAAWRPLQPAASPGTLPDLRGRRILLAEDNGTNQLLARQMLVRLGASVALADDGIEALAVCDRECPDLALIDIEMPRLDGLALMRTLRERGGAAGAMPMLALTAYVLPEDRRRIYDAGADGIVSKPIMDIAEFGQAVASLLAPGDPVPPAPTRPPRAGGRLAQLVALTGAALAPELVQRLTSDLARAQDDLGTAIADAALADVVRQAHVIVALAATLGDTCAERGARAIEAAARAGEIAPLAGAWAGLAHALDTLRAEIAAEAASLGIGA